MQSHIRAGDFPGAYSVLAAAEDSGIKLGPVLFTQLIVGLNDKGLFEKSWEVFDYMRINHCEPDVVTFTALINGIGMFRPQFWPYRAHVAVLVLCCSMWSL
jgi:pentatricopeptide repeat protein